MPDPTPDPRATVELSKRPLLGQCEYLAKVMEDCSPETRGVACLLIGEKLPAIIRDLRRLVAIEKVARKVTDGLRHGIDLGAIEELDDALAHREGQ